MTSSMGLPDGSRLAIAELLFYLPAFVISIIVNVRHGFRCELGWLYLILLSLIRIIGNSMEIAGHSENNINLFIGASEYLSELSYPKEPCVQSPGTSFTSSISR